MLDQGVVDVDVSRMAWRLEKFIEHGVIDNRTPGITTGRIWLTGIPEPLLLNLDGDCWRDLAGTKLEFTNPTPQQPIHLDTLDPDQVGLVGDMTAARRVHRNGLNDNSQSRLSNALYLEWFSESNGRVLIESSHFKLRISDHAWQLDEDEEEAQKLANLQAMRDFLARMIGRESSTKKPNTPEERAIHAKRLLLESQRISSAFGEVLEKYREDPDSERKEAFVMGWDRKLEALADREEAFQMRFPETAFDGEDNTEDDDDDENSPTAWLRPFNETGHDGMHFDDDGLGEFYSDEEPVVEKARDLCLRAMELCNQEDEADTRGARLMSSLLEVSSKLAAAFENTDHDDDDLEAMNFILTVLKQCLGFINQALSALQELDSIETNPSRKSGWADLKSIIFSVRDDVIEICQEIREEM